MGTGRKLVLLIILLLTVGLYGQDNKPTISKKDKIQFIEKVSELLNNYYVFPDVALKIEEHLKLKLNDTEFNNTNDKKEFARLITSYVQDISHDKHMRVLIKPSLPAAARQKADPILQNYEMKKWMEEDNYGFARIEMLDTRVGLVEIVNFPPLQAAKAHCDLAMKMLDNADALIFDLRKNSGGSPDLIQYLCSYLFEKPTHINSIYNRPSDKTEDFITFEEVDGKKLYDRAVFVLTSGRTFSGGEEFAYDIQTQKRGLLIGETTGGGANPGETYPVVEDLEIFIPTGRAINPITKTNWEGTGVRPDIEVNAASALDTAMVKARKAALLYRNKKDKAYYNYVNNINVNLEKAVSLLKENKKTESEELIKSTLTKAVDENVIGENAINNLGYSYMEPANIQAAISIFKLNTRLFPASPNTYDSLGEAYMKAGDDVNARINYSKVLELDPGNINAVNQLNKLGSQVKSK